MPAGMDELMPSMLELFITYQEGLVAAARPEAVIQPVAMVRISHCSSQAVAVWPNMKSTAPTMRFLT